MITYRIAPVAIVFPNSATASLPADKLSPMIPEPITVATKKKVPKNSARYFFISIKPYKYYFYYHLI